MWSRSTRLRKQARHLPSMAPAERDTAPWRIAQRHAQPAQANGPRTREVGILVAVGDREYFIFAVFRDGPQRLPIHHLPIRILLPAGLREREGVLQIPPRP